MIGRPQFDKLVLPYPGNNIPGDAVFGRSVFQVDPTYNLLQRVEVITDNVGSIRCERFLFYHPHCLCRIKPGLFTELPDMGLQLVQVAPVCFLKLWPAGCPGTFPALALQLGNQESRLPVVTADHHLRFKIGFHIPV